MTSDLFNYLTGYSRQTRYRKLLVSPVNLRDELARRIERESECARHSGTGRLLFKCNSLVDPDMIDASLPRLPVRRPGRSDRARHLRPSAGYPGLHDRIRVVSIVGRFLEHSRLYYFQNGGDEELYFGSADFMPRNLDNRVETLAPVEDKVLRTYLREEILEGYLLDNTNARELLPDGEYRRIVPGTVHRFQCGRAWSSAPSPIHPSRPGRTASQPHATPIGRVGSIRSISVPSRWSSTDARN